MLTLFIAMALFAAPARAGFVNGGFETGDFTGWTLEHGTANGGTVTFTPGAAGHAYVIGPVDDPYSPFDAPFNGSYMARLNETAAGADATRISQTATMQAGETDVYINWGAVLQDAGHPANEQAFFSILVRKNGVVVASESHNATPPAAGWTLSTNGSYYKNDQFHVGGLVAGDQVQVVMTVQDCSQGGHAGYAYLDGIGTVPPASITTTAPLNITSTSATLNGTVNPNGSATTAQFEYGLTTAYGGTASVTLSPSNRTTAHNVSAALTGLSPNTIYHYRLTATNANGTSQTSDGIFSTGPGALDVTFDTDGRVTTAIGGGGEVAYALAIQSDGKTVVAGAVDNGSSYDFAVVRYNADGSLDMGFGTGGKVTTSLTSGNDIATSVAVQSDGKIVVAGHLTVSGASDIGVVRYNSDGSLDDDTANDSTPGDRFGAVGAGGKRITDLGTPLDYGYAVAVQSDGKIVVAGSSTNGGDRDIALVRYTAGGIEDSSFGGGDGIVTTDVNSHDYAYAMALQSDGKIVIAGRSGSGGSYNFVVARYHGQAATGTPGNLDTTGFNSAGPKPGTVTTSISSTDDAAYSVALQRDGKIVVAGETDNAGDVNFAVVRYLSNGTLDTTTFGTGGKVTTDFGGGSDDYANAVAVQGDGKIVVAGAQKGFSNDDSCAVVRYNSDGTQDETFGIAGKVQTSFSASGEGFNAMALQSDGKIVAAGVFNNGTDNDICVARYLGGPNDLLVDGGFEANQALGGVIATSFGDWSKDQAQVVSAENGITPYEGARMAKFLGTDTGGAATFTASEIIQYVDLSGYAAALLGGPVNVTVTARVNRVAGGASTDTQFGIELNARSGTVTSGTVLGSNFATLISDSDTGTWETITNTFQLPAGTTNLVVNVYASENVVNNTVAPEFDGHYVDGVQLSVQTDFTPPTVTPVIIASSNANPAWAKLGDTVTVSFTASEPIQTPAVTLLGVAATVANPSGNNWTATAPVGAGSTEGIAAFSIAATDVAGNAAAAVTTTTDASLVNVDKTAPALTVPGNIVTGATSAAGAVVSFAPGVSDNLDPAPVLLVVPVSGSTFPIGVTTVNLTLTDAAGNATPGIFTVTVENRTNAPNFINAGTVPLVTDGFNAAGLSVGAVALGFDPAPGQVLTLVSNTSANPIGGAFTDLPDGGTVATSYGGRSLLFQANYAGGDGNDITLTLLNPEIVVEQPVTFDVPDGGSRVMPTVVVGTASSLTFTVKNTGPGILNGLTITKDGTDEALFTVTQSPVAPVSGPAGSTTFTVEFSSATSGAKTAALHIANDDADEHPFNITLTAQALSPSEDTDGDGLNDAAEFLLASLGYDWQVSQPALVSTLMTNANVAGLYTQTQYNANYAAGVTAGQNAVTADPNAFSLWSQTQYDANRVAGRNDVIGDPNPYGLYTPDQVQALHVGVPVLTRNAGGQFKLTIGIKKATSMTAPFTDFPFTAPDTTVNGQGRVEFLFTVPGNAAFFRLEAQK